MHITLVGIGMGNANTLTLEAQNAIEAAQLVLGAQRMLDSVQTDAVRKKAILTEDILRIVGETDAEKICVLCSGDTGFYSLATALRTALQGHTVTTLCGITTVQYLAAKLGRPWQNAALVSAHGKNCNVLGHVLANEEVFFLTGGAITPLHIVKTLCDAGMGDANIAVGENLSYANEKITQDNAENLRDKKFGALSAVWVTRGKKSVYPYCTGGIADDLFLRAEVPMTKQEVRAAVLSKLCIRAGETLYDVGTGTGSVAVEMALASPFNTVYAVEINPAAYDLMCKNRARFGAYNIVPVQGGAPDALCNLPAPDAVFIGGSKGNLSEIVQTVLQKNAAARFVISAIAVETLAEAVRVGKDMLTDVEITQIAVSRTCAVGNYHMLTAQNPIFLISGRGANA